MGKASSFSWVVVFFLWSLSAQGQSITTVRHFQLPHPVSNNAVASLALDGDSTLFFSFMGLQSGKTYQDIGLASYQIEVDDKKMYEIPPVPGKHGRLAGIAVGVENSVYIFGGYTVARDHSEVSTPYVHRYDPAQRRYTRLADMPTPVDDTIALVYQDRFIYLVSGWHNSGNVNLVQVYDIKKDDWNEATAYPGSAVFGHSGGIVGNKMIIADGVKKVMLNDEKYTFRITNECYQGSINPENPMDIRWRIIPSHPGKPLYRAASKGSPQDEMVLLAGGSTVAYNYNGIGYNGDPATPSGMVYAWSVKDSKWTTLGTLETATMDHRGLLQDGDQFYIVGGMRAGQRLSSSVISFRLPEITLK